MPSQVMHEMSVEERMGPGGLDPVEVFATLPVELQECCLVTTSNGRTGRFQPCGAPNDELDNVGA